MILAERGKDSFHHDRVIADALTSPPVRPSCYRFLYFAAAGWARRSRPDSSLLTLRPCRRGVDSSDLHQPALTGDGAASPPCGPRPGSTGSRPVISTTHVACPGRASPTSCLLFRARVSTDICSSQKLEPIFSANIASLCACVCAH